MSRGGVFTDSVKLVIEECFTCHIPFALTDAHRQRLLDKPGTPFWCPSGHSQHYTGKSEAEKQQERAERLSRELANAKEDLRSERAGHIVTKGKLTKARNRADKGVCQHCNRSFVNVARHVAGQHPGMTP